MKFSACIAGVLREAYTPSGLARIALGPPPASRVIPQAELGIILYITQEQLAKKADLGHTIVRGIAG